jgi:tetratricopeptide (TPR) repeat protein
VEGVERIIEEKNEIRHAEKSWDNVANGFRNLSHAQMLRGALWEAAGNAEEALFYDGIEGAHTPWRVARRRLKRPSSVPPHNVGGELISRVYRAQVFSLAGELAAASRDFAAADTIQRERSRGKTALYSVRGLWWCRHRLRLGDDAVAARSLVNANKAVCESNDWNEDVAQCDLLLGELDLAVGDLDSAACRVGLALGVFRRGRLGEHLPDAVLAMARLQGSVEDCEEALRLAARSGLGLMQCDALNLRALICLESGEPGKATEDARNALDVAERCGYYWGRHEALRRLRDAAKAIGNGADEKHWGEAEQELSRRMQPLIKEALEIEHAHDHDMKKLYGS